MPVIELPEHGYPAIVPSAPVSENGWTAKIDWQKLFIAVTKTVVDASFGSLSGAVKSSVDIVGAFGKAAAKDLTAEEQGWLFIQRAMATALVWTIRSNRKYLGAIEGSEEFTPELDRLLKADSVEVTHAFFDHPADSDLFASLNRRLQTWMAFIKVPETERERLSRCLGEELALALDLEERSRRGDYDKLGAFFMATMANEAARRARNWRRYRARLVEDVRKPLFNLDIDDLNAVGLQDVYIPLRAYWERAKDAKEGGARTGAMRAEPKARVVVWLDETIQAWFDAKKADDAIRIVSGEPGCGKSSFARMLAADLARRGRRVLYVPLHRYDFQGDAMHALSVFAALPDELGHDPVANLLDDDPLLVIFDGLDELSKAGDLANSSARAFVDHLTSRVAAHNNGLPRLMVLLAGRPVATEESTVVHRKPTQRLHILRYASAGKYWGDYEFADEALKADQRDQWWQGYFRATNRPPAGLPPEFQNKGRTFDEITAQPLLNYLLALLRDRSKDKSKQIDSAHALYREMFDYVYQRIHKSPTQGPDAVACIRKIDYEIILEEISIAAWHTDDRAVTKANLDSHFKSSEQGDLLKQHFGTIREGIGVILNSFFIQPDREDMGGYEFTHKSFREYLTARRLVRQVARMHDCLTRSPDIYRPKTALKEWLGLTGPVAMSFELLDFLRTDIASTPKEANRWIKTLVTVFELNLRDGMPVLETKLDNFRAAEDHARNGEESLFATLNACARAINKDPSREGKRLKRVSIRWGTEQGVGNLISRIRQRLYGIANMRPIITSCFSHIDMSGQHLLAHDLISSDFSGSSLSGSFLGTEIGAGLGKLSAGNCNILYEFAVHRAELSFAHLNGADLSKAYLFGVNLVGSNMSGANLAGANLREADLTGANLAGANLKGACIFGAKLFGANIDGANLEDAVGKPAVPPDAESPYSTVTDLAKLRG